MDENSEIFGAAKENTDLDFPSTNESSMMNPSEEELKKQIEQLQQENSKMKLEFDGQRAKMKELFLQKESELGKKGIENEELQRKINQMLIELNDLKTRLVVADMELENNVETAKRKAAEEIASLQQIVQETVEESSSTQVENKKLQVIISHLQNENLELKQHSPMHSHNIQDSLAPSLAQITKKISRKLGSEFFQSASQEGESDHHEDTELLKSLVGPLEEEIKALKDKLRATDEELQRCKQGDGGSGQVCDMCRNYEAELVREQQRVSALEAKVVAADKTVERHKEDLLKEIGFRKDMEEKWNEKREEHKKLVAQLKSQLELAEKDLEDTRQCFEQFKEITGTKVDSLSETREAVQQELDRLQRENEHLMGKYTLHSQEYESSEINLPNTVEELYESVLSLREELIIEKIGKEAGQETSSALKNENDLLREQLQDEQSRFAHFHDEFERLKDQVEIDRRTYKATLEKCKKREEEAVTQLEPLRQENLQLTEIKKTLESKNMELRGRVSSLQQELDNGEMVQKDFVRLSQNLQVQLEKIRGADSQVRWQHEEDAEDCPSCHRKFTSGSLRKEHCSHCGQIFCGQCLSHTVNSGRCQRPSKVCDVCHTLLVKSSAPYFSTEAPHSPD